MQSFGETNCGSVIPPAPEVGLGDGIGEERTCFAVRI